VRTCPLSHKKDTALNPHPLPMIIEEKAGNFDRALKHFTIAVRGGFSQSLQQIKSIYSKGYATKEDYTKALQSYQEYLAEIKSRQRDEAAAAREDYRYY